MLSDGDPRQIRKRIFICACVPAIDLFDDILIHRKRLIYERRTNRNQRRGSALALPGSPAPRRADGRKRARVLASLRRRRDLGATGWGEVGSKPLEKDPDFIITSKPALLGAGLLNQPAPTHVALRFLTVRSRLHRAREEKHRRGETGAGGQENHPGTYPPFTCY